ncbi:nucleotidyltransferase family protein [Xenorhabdus bovienii]|uniref:nucleotidyltransferase family protein n=1 Tax=Xenorhabdus bovienii TaxID=40576 RepID=UPI003DA5E864
MDNVKNLNFFRKLYAAYFHNQPLSLEDDLNLSFLNKHKLFPILEYVVRQQNLHKEIGLKDYDLISSYCIMLKHKQRLNDIALVELTNQLRKENIPYALRKGTTLAQLYHDPSHRISNDIDILVNKKYSKSVQLLLTEIGYTCGFYHHESGTIQPHKNSTLLKYRMSPDHLPHYTKLVDGIPLVIDVAFTLSWASLKDFLSTDEILANNSMVAGISQLSPQHNYLHTLLHLYRECFFLSSLKKRAPYLTSFIDVVLLNRTKKKYFSTEGEIDTICDHMVKLADALCQSYLTIENIINQNAYLSHKNRLIPVNVSFIELMFCSQKNYQIRLAEITSAAGVR